MLCENAFLSKFVFSPRNKEAIRKISLKLEKLASQLSPLTAFRGTFLESPESHSNFIPFTTYEKTSFTE